jgi:hypothetical protein
MAEEEGKRPPPMCRSTPDGVCGMHEVTEERRNSDRTRLTDLKTEFTNHKKSIYLNISDLCTFKNRTLGVGVLALVVVLGSYTFTYLHIQRSDAASAVLKVKIEQLARDTFGNTTQMAVLVEKVETTNNRLKETNVTIKELLDLMRLERQDSFQQRQFNGQEPILRQGG